jgi:formylglycine-generating enzyme required for sulfatase activity
MNTTHFLRAVIAILSLAAAAPASAQCTGDLTGNGIVDGADLGTILSYWGPRTQDPTSIASDLDGNGLINGADLGLVLSSWGPCQTTITSITPNQGCIIGGTQITITGTYLGSTSAVTIGGTSATSFTVINQNTVQAATPAGTEGPANVGVTTAAGTITATQQFTYMPASVSSIAPNTGITTGGFQITITGAYLALTTGVSIGGAPCTAVTVVNATTVTAMTPAGTLGNADVVITGGKGTVTVVGGYRYVTVVVPSWATLVEATPNPAVVTDITLRAAISASGLAWRVRDTATQMEMLCVPAGTFVMGCTASNQFVCDANEISTHSVTLTQAFYLGRYEVTQSQWVAKMGRNPSYFRGQSYPDEENRPVEQVTWNDIQDYLNVTGMRLPSEAEWEYACRAGTATAFHSMPGYPNGTNDDDQAGAIAWYTTNSEGQTHAVGGKAANALGLHDMAGNVWEWVNDRYESTYYSASPSTNPLGPVSGSDRVLRGGSWPSIATGLRSSFRNHDVPGGKLAYYGFRVARNP